MAADLLAPRQINVQPWCVLHELAHAYHDQVLGFEEARILAAYAAYKKSGHGSAVLLVTGGHVPHYGLTDHKEFFAEMTESYFGVNDFFPFNRGTQGGGAGHLPAHGSRLGTRSGLTKDKHAWLPRLSAITPWQEIPAENCGPASEPSFRGRERS